ncbi:hypothetical protein VTO58DRAFT_109564 [Aureobasidium pullulans]|nr:hypothetical protein D6C80_05161 [Aureobasidium pullulans]
MKASLAIPLTIVAMTQHAAAAPCPSQGVPGSDADRLNAMIYRGTSGCEGCSESVQVLLESAYPDINVTFAGPDEDVQINAESLRQVDIFVQPGGPDLEQAWEEAEPYAADMRDFVARGGWYLGFCLGAFLAGPDTGFGLIPEGDKAAREIERPNAQVDDMEDTVIQVDWTFSTGKKQGTTERERWLYFQDGAAFILSDHSPTTVLARYSQNGDVASTLNAFGQGWVANVGPHPEADQSWYDLEDVGNPEGVRSDIGIDFVRAALGTASRNTHDKRMAKLTAMRDLIAASED